jgi:hypothetical protein
LIVVSWLAAFGRFWYRFIIGDDWTIAVAIAGGLLVVYLLRTGGYAAWWLMPVIVVAALSLSVYRAEPR